MGNCVALYRCTGIAALDRQNNIPLVRQDYLPFAMARKRNASKVTPRRPSRRVSISLSTLLGVHNSDPPNTSAGPLGTVAKNTASSKTPEQRGSSRRSVIKLKELREESVENNLFKEQHRSMPISADRQSRVTFGSGRGNDKN